MRARPLKFSAEAAAGSSKAACTAAASFALYAGAGSKVGADVTAACGGAGATTVWLGGLGAAATGAATGAASEGATAVLVWVGTGGG